MSHRKDYFPGDLAPAKGTYEQINLYRRPNGIRAYLDRRAEYPWFSMGYAGRIPGVCPVTANPGYTGVARLVAGAWGTEGVRVRDYAPSGRINSATPSHGLEHGHGPAS